MDFQERRRIRREQMDKGLRDPMVAFCSHRSGAKRRGIGWELTFEQWWGIWNDYYHLRGHGRNGLVMAREGDKGPYAVGNVYLTTNLGNLIDYHNTEKATKDRLERRLRIYAAKQPPRWGKAFGENKESGLVKAKNYWNGVEIEKQVEDA